MLHVPVAHIPQVTMISPVHGIDKIVLTLLNKGKDTLYIMLPHNEHRHFARVAFDAKATFTDNESGQQWSTQVIDICLKGALFKRPDQWEGACGDQLTLLVLLSDDVRIRMEVTVAHVENDHIGCNCEHIDLDSITNLRRLIELNLANEKLLDRELHELIATSPD